MDMELRLAVKNDLTRLKMMYREIIEHMDRNNIRIWDDVYPCEFFDGDITNQRLYVLTEGDEIAAAFALSESNAGESYLKWKDVKGKALYIDRFGVNVKYTRQGIGVLALTKAAELAKRVNAGYLRLFVVDINQPAINLYLKNGFKRVDGIYEQKVEETVLYEYGFEKEL